MKSFYYKNREDFYMTGQTENCKPSTPQKGKEYLSVLPGQIKPRGFTLIELLVVIAIIAILAGMLLPAVSTARERSKSINCVSNFKQVYTAWFNYANDFNENVVRYNALQFVEGKSNTNTYWYIRLAYTGYLPYSRSGIAFQVKPYLCPSDSKPQTAWSSNFSSKTSYGYHRYAMPEYWADNSATGKKYQGFRTLKQANAYTKDMMIFADNWKHPGNTDSNGIKGPWNLSETGYYSFGRYGAHKTKTVNGAYMDGSCRAESKIFQLTSYLTNQLWLLSENKNLATRWVFQPNN